MHYADVLVLTGFLAFFTTMIDNLLAFAGQLAVTPRHQFAAVSVAQSVGVGFLVGLAVAVGASLNVVPLRWVGVLALAPWGLAWHHWRRRDDAVEPSPRRGVATTFIVTVGLGGDNLAVWIPLLRASGAWREVALVAVFALGQILFVGLSWALATRPRVSAWAQRRGDLVVPWLYAALGVAILFECGVL
ncbi:MAG: cadmium resistance transporter [Acidobacteriota bacterium]|nr:cadmium resistance transporter [Acidobacteriota bacterium]MDE3147376.1 cadmium resistance transporter [Acidobacteriota bacterium]